MVHRTSVSPNVVPLKHDLQGRPRTGAVDKKQAFLDRERRAIDAEYPDLAVRKHDLAPAAVAFRASAIGMQMEVDRVRQILLQPEFAPWGLQNIDAVELVTCGRKPKAARMQQTEALEIAVVGGVEHGLSRLVGPFRGDGIGTADRKPTDHRLKVRMAD